MMLSRTTTFCRHRSAVAAAAATRRAMMSVLVVSEPLDAGAVSPATQSTVTAAQQLDSEVDLLITGATTPTKIPSGVSKVLHCITTTTEESNNPVAETVALAIQKAKTDQHNYILGPSSKFGSTVIPRAAALFGLSPVTDVLSIEGSDTFIRPMYAGNALCKVKMLDDVKVLSIRPTAFDKAELVDIVGDTEVETLEGLVSFEHSKWMGESVSSSDASDRPDLGSASTVVSGGRGLGSGENFDILENLATKLGAAVGASRAAVDAGYCPNDWQVGQTGKVVAPDLYIAIGISGAIQHLSGMKDSKTIVAINKDPEAPIFQVADYGLVADLFQAVPELTDKV